ncbi:MAG: hypothetical protein II837_05770, partial [Treponema sp.]|nr:hypothetical protein [Treponema sp.]
RLRFFYFARGATICHQAIFARRKTFYNNEFDLRYEIVADRLWLKKSIEERKCSYKHIDFPICIYDITGISSDLFRLRKDSKKFIRNEYGFIGLLYAKLVGVLYGLCRRI